VTHVALCGEELEVTIAGATGNQQTITAAQVLFALPPRILEATVSLAPALDAGTTQRWRDTATWMAPHAKFFAVYSRPFWRDTGLSGSAQSLVGPLVEIHDATTASGNAALFGFVGVSAQQRSAFGNDALIAASIQQLAQLFGPQAASPRATLLKDWAADPLTATAADAHAGEHPAPSHQPWVSGEWRDRIALAGSETSGTEPGYLAGAVEAAERAFTEIISRLGT
jgi:monoamine oxidase